MKNLLLYFTISIFFPLGLISQNLVTNPSFEDYIICPTAADEVNYLTGWSNFGASPDYFNACDNGISGTLVGVPFNFGGFQPATSGNGYCGVLTYVSPVLYPYPGGYREYIGQQLSNNLIIGTKYFVSLKANCMNINTLCPSNCASNNLGVKFTNEPYNPGILNIPNSSQIKTNTIYTDTMNWTKIFGSFIADSAYQYIIIGNFFDYNHTDTLKLDGDNLCRGAYYYIDDICVSTDSDYTINWVWTGIDENEKINHLISTLILQIDI
jgi:hypothetical protein